MSYKGPGVGSVSRLIYPCPSANVDHLGTHLVSIGISSIVSQTNVYYSRHSILMVTSSLVLTSKRLVLLLMPLGTQTFGSHILHPALPQSSSQLLLTPFRIIFPQLTPAYFRPIMLAFDRTLHRLKPASQTFSFAMWNKGRVSSSYWVSIAQG